MTTRSRLIAVGVALVGVGLALWFGGWDLISDPDRIVELLRDSGWVGALVFVLSMWIIQPFGVPGTFFMLPAAIVWPWPTAITLSWVGNMGASIIAFAFARWAGREWVSSRIPPRIAHFDRKLSEGGVGPVVVLRLATGQLPPADWFLGVSRLPFTTFLVGTAIGILPGIVVAVVIGGSALTWGLEHPAFLVAGGMAILIVGAIWWRRRPWGARSPGDGTAERSGPTLDPEQEW